MISNVRLVQQYYFSFLCKTVLSQLHDVANRDQTVSDRTAGEERHASPHIGQERHASRHIRH